MIRPYYLLDLHDFLVNTFIVSKRPHLNLSSIGQVDFPPQAFLESWVKQKSNKTKDFLV